MKNSIPLYEDLVEQNNQQHETAPPVAKSPWCPTPDVLLSRVVVGSSAYYLLALATYPTVLLPAAIAGLGFWATILAATLAFVAILALTKKVSQPVINMLKRAQDEDEDLLTGDKVALSTALVLSASYLTSLIACPALIPGIAGLAMWFKVTTGVTAGVTAAYSAKVLGGRYGCYPSLFKHAETNAEDHSINANEYINNIVLSN